MGLVLPPEYPFPPVKLGWTHNHRCRTLKRTDEGNEGWESHWNTRCACASPYYAAQPPGMTG